MKKLINGIDSLVDEMLDGMRLIEDITFSDSMGNEIIALNNGSFIIAENGSKDSPLQLFHPAPPYTAWVDTDIMP